MIRWLRVVLPPAWVLVAFGALYAIFEGSLRLLEWRLGVWLAPVHPRPGTTALCTGCLGYAGFRIVHFYPVCNRPYRQWLRNTPWSSSRLLPLGPVHLVWQDGVVLTVMALLAYLQPPDLNPLHLVTIFLVAYQALLALNFRATGQWALFYAVAFGLGLVVRLWHYPWAAMATAVLVYPLAYAGLRRSQANFPWDLSWQEELHRGLSGQGKGYLAGEADMLGWPFERLWPKLPKGMRGISTRDAILASLLAGWWLYAVASLPSDAGLRLGIVLTVHLAAVALLVACRLVAYRTGHKPPINAWGRLWTFRWIIPGYDKVFLGPLAAVLIGVLLPEFSVAQGLEPEIALPLSLSVAMLACFCIGPSLLDWHLTGQHRLVPGVTLQQRCLKVG
jgi:hypothetical protein